MAIDQTQQLLQMLLQGGGGGGISISPTSGLQDPSLSGLALGPQGMGVGGGESLMGGGPVGFGGSGGGGGGGLDISQLLAQLQAAPGVTGAGLTSGIGAGRLGGFGVGGQLGQEPIGSMPTASQQGQAGLGAANTTAQLLNLLREGVGLNQALAQLFPRGPSPTDLQGLNLGGVLGEFPEQFGAVAGARFPPEFPIEASGTAAPGGGTFSQTGNIIPSLGGIVPGAVESAPAAITAPFLAGGGPESSGQLAGLGPAGGTPGLGGAVTGFGGGLGLGGGILGALNAQSDFGRAAGATSALGGGLTLASLIPGLQFLLPFGIGAGVGGGLGGLFEGLFGGGGNSRQLFNQRVRQTTAGEQGVMEALLGAIPQTQGPQDLQGLLQEFRQAIQNVGVGGFMTAPGVTGPPGFQIPGLPEAFAGQFGPLTEQVDLALANQVARFS